MDGIGTLGRNTAHNALTLNTFETRVAEKTLATIRANASAVSKAAWRLEAAMQRLRKAQREGASTDEAEATADVFAAYTAAEIFMLRNFVAREVK